MSTENIIKKFILNLKLKKRSPSTIIAYKKDIEQLNDFVEQSGLVIQNAQAETLQKFIDKLISENKFTLKTISRKINSIKTFYKFLLEEKIVKENHAAAIKHPKFKSELPRILSPLEYKALRDTVKNNLRLYTMVEILLQTGMRIGELSRLQLSHVQKESSKTILVIVPFASNPKREIELNESAQKAIEEWLKVRSKNHSDRGYMFQTRSGNPVLVRNIRTSINRAFKKVGIKDATVNDIRNTFIVHQIEHGVDLEIIARTVGHQRITSTEKYLEFINNRPKKIIKKLQVL